jgi:CheY-like chemotaxis protein
VKSHARRERPKSDPTNHERPLVLVVDDEVEVRKNLRRLLEREGYEVVTVASSLHAIESLWDLPNLACVISDQKMGGPSGVTLRDYIAQERPRIGRILYTGFFPATSTQQSATATASSRSSRRGNC